MALPLGINFENKHPKSAAREVALQFMYKCEIEKLYFFAAPAFGDFVESFDVPTRVAEHARELLQGCYEHWQEINEQISKVSANWKLERLAATDRCTLRLAIFELRQAKEPQKVILNEAIELAKKYGTENSGSFVNGVLDKIARDTDAHVSPALS